MERRKLKDEEHKEQVALIQWWRYAAPPGLEALLFAIPNGGRRDAVTGARLKAEGVRAGVPDLFLACPVPPHAGLWIEMKRLKGGQVSKSQAEMHEVLRRQGYGVEVCRGWIEAREKIRQYLRSWADTSEAPSSQRLIG